MDDSCLLCKLPCVPLIQPLVPLLRTYSSFFPLFLVHLYYTLSEFLEENKDLLQSVCGKQILFLYHVGMISHCNFNFHFPGT